MNPVSTFMKNKTALGIHWIMNFHHQKKTEYLDYITKEKSKLMEQIHREHLDQDKPIEDLPTELDPVRAQKYKELKKQFLFQRRMKTALHVSKKVLVTVKTIGTVKTVARLLKIIK